MMKRLNKTHKYAIQWLYSQKHSIEEIVTELNIPKNLVVSCLEKNQNVDNSNNNIKEGSSSTKGNSSKNLMINKTSVKKNNSVMIMTKEASMLNDEQKKDNIKSKKKATEESIFRPNK